METLVITRPKADAKKLSRRLMEKGFNCIVEPILSIRTLYENGRTLQYALERKPQAILVTSKYSVDALAAMTDERSIPIIAVGRATAEHALHLGFSQAVFAKGNAHSLITYVSGNYSPENGGMLYIRGIDISVDIAARLARNGFMVDSVTLYQAKAVKKLSEALCSAIREREVDGILFFSQNTVRAYADLAISGHIAEAHDTVIAMCMSRTIADKAATLLKWKEVTLFPEYLKNMI